MSRQKILYLLMLCLGLFVSTQLPASTAMHGNHHYLIDSVQTPLLIYESPYSLTETIKQVKRAIVGQNFKFIRQQSLDEALGVNLDNEKKEVILYFCNFNKLSQALTLDKRVGAFLPCRISVVERNGRTFIMAVDPKALNSLFDNNRLSPLCDDMKRVYTAILEEASL